jgi:hypothetical protein
VAVKEHGIQVSFSRELKRGGVVIRSQNLLLLGT